MPITALKDPDDTADYELTWSTFLGVDTVTSSTWLVPTGITKVSESNTTTTATVRLSGGTAGAEYECVNRVNTASGCQYDRTLIVFVTDR